MCVVSMVSDHYQPLIIPWTHKITPNIPHIDQFELDKLVQLLRDYREAIEAAEKVDRLTKQPDCIDPEKLVLQKRIEELEREVEMLRSKKHNRSKK